MEHFAGIEIVDTHLQIVIGDDRGNILQRFSENVDRDAGAAAMCARIKKVFQDIDKNNIKSIGVGFGGPVDYQSGKIRTSYDMEGWTNFPLRQWLAELTGIYVSVENDANAAALGEALFGAGRNYENIFFVKVDAGVGAGHVVNKSIYHGKRPGESELGHIRLDKNGLTVQEACSVNAISKRVDAIAAVAPKSNLVKQFKKQSDVAVIRELFSDGDTDARNIFEEIADDLSFALSHAVHLLHPETIIIGGNPFFLYDDFRKMVEDRLSRYVMDAFGPGPDVQLSKINKDAVAIGALALAVRFQGN